jgi:16S rRNA (uracil1498-N3)-methyltransferase
MPKFFIPPGMDIHDEITLTGEPAHHLLHVLRLRPGNPAILCDGNNTDYFCDIITSTSNTVRFRVIKKEACRTELPFRITLYQSIPKGDKMDLIIQKSVELGVTRIVPVYTQRTVAREKNASLKTQRYQRIVDSAACQAMRGIIPTVSPPASFAHIISSAPTEPLWLAAYENERITTVKSLLTNQPPSNIGIWVGPEGGFTDEEMNMLQHRAIPVTLGPRILRTETAALATLAQILCCWEGL